MEDKKEKLKIYNNEYYKTNKINIIKKACEPVVCELCNRTISKNAYNSHIKTKLCKNTQLKNKYILERTEI